MRMKHVGSAVAVMTLLLARFVAAQSTTGTISGHVTDSQGLALPGVTVAVASTALQGIRTTSTSEMATTRSHCCRRHLHAHLRARRISKTGTESVPRPDADAAGRCRARAGCHGGRSHGRRNA